MKIFEVLDKQLAEGGKSGGVRYNSEVGLLYGLVGKGPFDPKNPEKSIPASILINPEQTYKDIKSLLAPNYDAAIFDAWAGKGPMVREKIVAKQGRGPTKLGWAGGQNIAAGVTDVEFQSGPTAGISVKAEGGITLANLTPAALGIETDRGVDVFAMHAGEEYNDMKEKVFADVLKAAQATPGTPLIPIDRYGITYDDKTKKYTINLKGDKNVVMTSQEIMSAVGKNSQWQRVFGDWFQANWATKKDYATPLYSKIAKVFEVIIERTLNKSGKLSSILRFGEQPYYYLSAKGLYYVPAQDEVADLKLKGLKYAQPDGTSQRFIAVIGRPDSDENAELDIYIRYANGMFATQPTVRIQSLKNPQFIGWELL
jgi:phosphotransferase system IIA component